MPAHFPFLYQHYLALTGENSSVTELGPSRPRGCKAIQSRPFVIKGNHHVQEVHREALLTRLPSTGPSQAPGEHFSSEDQDRGFFSAILQGTQPRVQPGQGALRGASQALKFLLVGEVSLCL